MTMDADEKHLRGVISSVQRDLDLRNEVIRTMESDAEQLHNDLAVAVAWIRQLRGAPAEGPDLYVRIHRFALKYHV